MNLETILEKTNTKKFIADTTVSLAFNLPGLVKDMLIFNFHKEDASHYQVAGQAFGYRVAVLGLNAATARLYTSLVGYVLSNNKLDKKQKTKNIVERALFVSYGITISAASLLLMQADLEQAGVALGITATGNAILAKQYHRSIGDARNAITKQADDEHIPQGSVFRNSYLYLKNALRRVKNRYAL